MTYEEALSIIIKKQSLGIMPGLSRIEKLLKEMGSPQNKIKVIHIAGTNGKGTVASTLADALHKNGFNVGLFTSPWVDDYREQIQLNGTYISKEDFARYIDEYKECNATEFELLTAIMYKYFCDKGVDYAVVECGMGGLEDSTNAVDKPVLSVITSVALDHTGFLGNTLAEIAKQKAGIIKKNSATVLYPNEKCESIFEEKCFAENNRLIKINDMGDFKKNNLAVVNACLDFLGIPVVDKTVSLPARQELFGNSIMLDGAHNEDGALALLKALPDKKISAVIGMMKDKNYDAYLSLIAPKCSKIYAVAVNNPRSLPATELAQTAKRYCSNVTACENPHKALSLARQDDCFVLVCGSFYLAREIRKDLM